MSRPSARALAVRAQRVFCCDRSHVSVSSRCSTPRPWASRSAGGISLNSVFAARTTAQRVDATCRGLGVAPGASPCTVRNTASPDVPSSLRATLTAGAGTSVLSAAPGSAATRSRAKSRRDSYAAVSGILPLCCRA